MTQSDTDDSTATGSTDEPPDYACRECAWRGDEYLLLDDGTLGGRAVCPECEGALRLARD